MKREDFIKSLADALKVDVKILTEELKKEDDIKLELPKLNAFTEAELATRDANIKKGGYDEGVTVGFDKSAKKLKEVSGVEVEGLDISKIAEAIVLKTNTDAKTEPNAKIKELSDSLAKLQTTVTTLESEKETLNKSFEGYKTESQLLSEIPKNKAGLSNKTVLAEMRESGYDFTNDGVTKNGELLKDNLQNPVKRQEVFAQFLTEKNWIEVDKDGRGGGDEGGKSSTIKTMDDYQNYCKDAKIDPLSEDGKAVLIQARKENNF
ncbi:hypothetical protein QLS91_12990 [Flavobacterium sp. LB2P84]|uniref:hypothetical protein n=1 Tax=Flavobacterium yafengii TaxID=3041253 RepID=UPI0024A8BB02|nr:hypothetical protein [Flavobacterium yafengii]MDI6033990.1 hypothetical protein [Flavobacterium yafengii]